MIQGIIRQSEFASVGGSKKRPCLMCVRFSHGDFNGPEAIERQAMRVSQRFPSHCRRNPRRLQERANLLCMNLAAGHEHATQLLIHAAPPSAK